MAAGYSFRPRAWALALAAGGCAAGILLGNWQSDRAAQKRLAGASVEQISMRGEFEPQHTVLLDNKVHRGRPGYHVIQPLAMAGGKRILVNRGWVPAGASRDRLPDFGTPRGEVAVSGVRLAHFPQAYAPQGGRPAGQVWQNVTLKEFSVWSGLALEPFVIEQHSTLDDRLVRDWPRAGTGVEKHESYALQWYSLAVLSLVLLLVLNVRHGNPGS